VFQKEAINIIPESIAKRFNVLPLMKEDDTLTVVISDPLDLPILENLQTVTNCSIKSVISSPKQIKNNIEIQYNQILSRFVGKDKEKEVLPILPLEQRQNAWPLIPSLLRLIIDQAFRNSVNLIHIQPEQNRMKIFFRINRRLEKVASYPKGIFLSILDFVKKAAKMNLEIKGIPQAGYFVCNTGELNIEVGVSIFPTISGDRIVLEVPRTI
jgi:type IV pilus assembly protein PilB